jgi:hypothetical protein
MTLAELLDKLERGRIGHSEAMRWLGVDSYAARGSWWLRQGRCGGLPKSLLRRTGYTVRWW